MVHSFCVAVVQSQEDLRYYFCRVSIPNLAFQGMIHEVEPVQKFSYQNELVLILVGINELDYVGVVQLLEHFKLVLEAASHGGIALQLHLLQGPEHVTVSILRLINDAAASFSDQF